MISIKNLFFSYGKGREILHDLTVDIKDGDRICLFGESGSGKSTLLRLIEGLEVPKSGSVDVSGKITAVFQDDRLLPFKTVLQNAQGFTKSSRATSVLEELGMGAELDKYPSELSGGMARRVALARALAYGGDIYIFDEPFNGMDEENISAAADLINRETEGKTVILVTHDVKEAELLKCSLYRL